MSVTSTYGLERVCAYFMFISLLHFYFVCVMFILCLYCFYIMFMCLCMFMEEGASQRVISEEGGRAAT